MANADSTASIKNQPFDFKNAPHWAWKYDNAKSYLGGCESGNAAAIAYVKFAQERDFVLGGSLQHAAIGMAEMLAKVEAHSEEYAAIKGRMVGFFSLIDQYVDFAAKHSISNFRNITVEDIFKRLDDAAKGIPEQLFNKTQVKIRRDNARNAANVRWSKVKSLKDNQIETNHA